MRSLMQYNQFSVSSFALEHTKTSRKSIKTLDSRLPPLHTINAFVRSSFTHFYFTNGFIVSTFSSVIFMAASRTGQSSSQSTSIDVNFCVVSVSFSVYPFYHHFSINLHSRHRSRAYSLHSPHLTSYWCLVIPSCNPI